MTNDEPEWQAIRNEFSFDRRFIPMNAANMCPPPRQVVEAIEHANRSVDADVSFHHRDRYAELREKVRRALARLLDADPDEVAIVRNASEGNNILVAGLDLGPGDEVLIWDQNHASNALSWETAATRRGFTVRRLALPSAPASADELLQLVTGAFRAHTRVLACSDVSNASGLRLPAKEICRAGRERGMHVHLDGAQTLGAMRLSMRSLGCGSYTASAQKWLMGPREAGVLFVRADRIRELWPAVVSRGYSDPDEPAQDSARKLETLGQRNEGVLAGLAAAIEFVERIGPDRIEARIRSLADYLKDGLLDIPGYRLVTPRAASLSLGVVVGSIDGIDPEPLHDRLYTRHGIAAAPTGGLRLCPHIYTLAADLDRVVAAVALECGEG